MKKLGEIFFFVSMIIIAGTSRSAFAAQNSSKPIALIYNGPGTCKGCPETIGDRLEEMGYVVQYVGATENKKKSFITLEKLRAAKLYVQPGGSDVLNDTLSKMTVLEKENIRTYVREGGTYIGVCAGGYLAGRKLLDEGKLIDGLGLIPCTIVDYDLGHPKARVEPIYWLHHGDKAQKSDLRNVYFQDGPKFCGTGVPDQRIYAVYRKTGDIAAMTGSFGRGKVGLIGPHPEADPDWFEDKNDGNVPTPKRLSRDLFREMVSDLNPSSTLAASTSRRGPRASGQ